MGSWESMYDAWKTTDPRDYEPRCPDCDNSAIDDGYGGVECIECEWSMPGPDPDAARDRWMDQELLDDECLD